MFEFQQNLVKVTYLDYILINSKNKFTVPYFFSFWQKLSMHIIGCMDVFCMNRSLGNGGGEWGRGKEKKGQVSQVK